MLKKTNDKRLSRKPVIRKQSDYREILVLSDLKVTSLIESMSRFFPTARLTVLVPRLTKEMTDHTPYQSYHKSDFNLTGKPKNDKLTEVLSRAYDLVVDLSKTSKLNDSIFRRIQAGFFIGGNASTKAEYYDLQIEQQLIDNQNIAELINHLTLLTQHGN